MLRRPATTLAITAEDIAAYEDRRARETMLRERQVLMQAQQQQQEHQQQRILQQQLAPQGLSSSPQRGHTPAEIHQLQQMQQAARFQQQQMQQQDADMTAESLQDYDEEQQEELLRRQQDMMRAQRGQQRAGLQTTPTPGDGGRGGRSREERIGVGRRGR
ncbi:hypothetical protein CSOJ01_13831 [Colletotrichum sojae]|uniref:Anaphase-promoting complex, subunit CDC26 n=1 Tax=Colletotrichum sojae TaxID=2175907 RepID=A0A8H6MJU2_9PEZI|nr:hypothetical protein CSOJ01_13831 [Colletotrichum sojae]